jgi:hypothetical protein
VEDRLEERKGINTEIAKNTEDTEEKANQKKKRRKRSQGKQS